jgi:hypothetical protein
MISDSYDLIDIDGVAYEADCRMVTVGGESFGAFPRYVFCMGALS